jgi:signal transduction histidine kinase
MDEFWKFGVTDNGPGIEETQVERIFQLPQASAPQDTMDGIGIELPLVKRIIESYGGRIWVESEVGKGSAFFFTLPRQRTEVSDATTKANAVCAG